VRARPTGATAISNSYTPKCAGTSSRQRASATPASGGIVVPSGISLSVIKVAQAAQIAVGNGLAEKTTVSAAQWASAATATQAEFANWEEVGFTANLQRWILANQTLFTGTPTTAQLMEGWATLQSSGLLSPVITETQYENSILGVPLANRQYFLSYVQANGLVAVHAQIVSALNSAAALASKSKLEKFLEAIMPQAAVVHAGGLTASGWLGIAATYLGIASLAVVAIAGAPAVITGLAVGSVALGLAAGWQVLNGN
jgi:hypothetical protein